MTKAETTKASERVGIRDHEGNKYVRRIRSCVDPGASIEVDVYSVLVAFGIENPAVAHAAKKVLCAGIRGKGSVADDLLGAIAALNRALEIEGLEQASSRPSHLQCERAAPGAEFGDPSCMDLDLDVGVPEPREPALVRPPGVKLMCDPGGSSRVTPVKEVVK